MLMSRPLVKICGITNPDDALSAIKAGADWLGLIFVPGTPRFISIEVARIILDVVRTSKVHVEVVGVFQNAAFQEIQDHLAVLSLDRIQLHGEESPDFCSAFSVPVVKTLFLNEDADFSCLRQLAASYKSVASVKTLLLDLPKEKGLQSITQFMNDEELGRFFQDFPCLMAGGLKPDTISDVLNRFQAIGVDVASGVEQSVGKKDISKMNQFCQLVKSFELQMNRGDNNPCSL